MIRVLIADDEALVRSGLRMIVESTDDVRVAAEAADGRAAVTETLAHRPDVVLMDIRMPRLDGLAATRELAALAAPPRVIVLTTFHLDEYVHDALRAGAAGFLLKDTPPRELLHAIRVVAGGEAMLSPVVTRRLIETFASGRSAQGALARERLRRLTPREREVLALVAEGCSNAEAGRRLQMSEATVKTHVSRLLDKLEAANRVQVALVAFDAGLLDTPRG
ncbi:response regulator [Conexibacter woesei]|uniref:Two component transcriptional regulator, LuxR family n=1 Tax=Conexibacter woesei (strain DSM 14684 / CCUG 47730 / CIP 108061 / JCM 11494 / NBRC 100937 / ID131577) TaxID=469383 RepID=D3F731_CONWI|nr:response regulator transcription factor [Conexibacter woesei]ADB48802.1 two component transcriptional regulator, LuxR family [Conexibacter woesei DSM 14684]